MDKREKADRKCDLEQILLGKLGLDSKLMAAAEDRMPSPESEVTQWLADRLKEHESAMVEWLAHTGRPCFQRMQLIHPVTNAAYLEFVTFRDFGRKRQYIAVPPETGRDEPYTLEQNRAILRLRPGQMVQLLGQIAHRALVLYVSGVTSAAD